MPTRMAPSTSTNTNVPWIGSRSVITTGETLNTTSAKPIASTNANAIWPRVSSDPGAGSGSSSVAAA